MSNGGNKLTCLECGQQIESQYYEWHMKTVHGAGASQGMTRTQQRLQAQQAKKGSGARIAAGAIITVIALLAVGFIFYQPSENDSGVDDFQDTEEQPDIVEIPPEDENDNQNNNNDDNGTSEEPEPITALKIPASEITTDAKWYPYDSDGVEIRFFAVRSNDNEIHVAFDACDVCYETKMGYRQEGVQMTCNNCDKSFPIKAIGSENMAGGCWPSYLPMTEEDDDIIIKISDLEEKKWMFE